MNKSWRFRHHESWTLQLLNMLGVWRIENGPLTILCLKREKLKNFFERKLRFEELSSTTELLFWQSDWYLETLTKVSVHCESVSVRLHKQSRSQHFCIESSNPVSNLPSRNNEGSMLTGLADKMGELERGLNPPFCITKKLEILNIICCWQVCEILPTVVLFKNLRIYFRLR